MAELRRGEFHLIRYVPDPVRDEFVNIGLLLLESGDDAPARPHDPEAARFVEVRFTRDWSRLRCLDPEADTEMLEALEAEWRRRLRAGHAGAGGRERLLAELADSLSNQVRLTEARGVLAASWPSEMETLERLYVVPPRRGRAGRAGGARTRILGRMRDRFERAGVWELMRKRIPVALYTQPGDPLRIDCGYRPNGTVRLFQAIPLDGDVDAAKALAFSAPVLAAGLRRVEDATLDLAAVTDAGLDFAADHVRFAVGLLEGAGVRVATTNDLERMAETARRELRA